MLVYNVPLCSLWAKGAVFGISEPSAVIPAEVGIQLIGGCF